MGGVLAKHYDLPDNSMKKEEKFYNMRYTCSNCGEEFFQSFKFGERASRGNCPHCGCYSGQEPTLDMRQRVDEEKKYL